MEREIEKLIETLKKMTDDKSRTGAITGSLAGKSAKDQKEFQKQLEKTIKSMKEKKKLDDEEIKNLKDINKEFDKAEESVADFSDSLDKASSMAGPFVKTMFELGSGAAKTTGGLTQLSGMFAKFGLVGDVVQALAGSLDYNMNVFRELSQVGASFGKSLIGMREAAHSAMLPLGEFAGIVADNAMALSSLYGTTEAGIKSLAQFSLAIRDKALQEGLYNLGITTDELNEYMGTYLVQQRFAQVRENLTAAQVAERTTKYAKQLDLLAKATGIQRSQIDDAIKQQQSDALLQKALTGLTVDETKEANAFLGVLKTISPAMHDNAKMMIESGIPLDDFGAELMGLSPELADLILNFKDLIRSGKSADDVLAMMAPYAQQLQEMPQAVLAQFPQLADSLLKLGTMNMDVAKGQQEQQVQAGKTLEVMGDFDEQLNRLKVEFAQMGTEFLKGLTPAVAAFKDFIIEDLKGFVEKIVELIKGFSPANFGKALMAALAGALIFDFAKQVSIVAMGTAIGMGKSGVMGRLGKAGLKVGGVAAGLGGAYASGEYAAGADTHAKKGLGAAGAAASGALIGSIIPGIGTLVGAAVGGLIGAGYGLYKGYNEDAVDAKSFFNKGTMGTGALFQDFGSGTPAMLHGMEAVVTPGQLRGILNSDMFVRGPAPYDPNRSPLDGAQKLPFAEFKDGLDKFRDGLMLVKDRITGGGDDKLIGAINNLNKTLNTNNMIASMIERNTKSTNNNLANMSGSLV